MPQATTHYLVTRRAIPRDHCEKWWDIYKPYFGLGSVSPDLFYFLIPKFHESLCAKYLDGVDCGKISDMIHHEKSYDLFCKLLETAKKSKISGEPGVGEKQFAFAFGFYCHVVTDCIFHPYVYRSTGDHWNTSTFRAEQKHKIQEFKIDRGIHRDIRKTELEVGSTNWRCVGDSDKLLDHSIAELFHKSLQDVYKENYPVKSDQVSDDDHLIQESYEALNDLLPTILKGEKLLLIGQRKTIIIQDTNDDYFYSTKYTSCSGLPEYTPQELFNFASVACRAIFNKSLDFWEDPSDISPHEFFESDPVDYLGRKNWNLDTGLPSHYNEDPLIKDECSEHDLSFIKEITDVYDKLSSRYNPTDFTY